jgi:hypothetical protein
MTFFTILKSPLMFGGNLPDTDAFTLSLLTNTGVLKMHRESTGVEQVFQENDKRAVKSKNPLTGETYLALFNTGSTPEDLSVTAASLGLPGIKTVTDMWTGARLGAYADIFTQTLPPHGSGLYTVEEIYAGYLFAYFTGNAQADEQLHFALSEGDTPFTFKALNGDKPVLLSGEISEMGGIRDPYLMRGEDGMFYMALTDMASSKGWTSNRGIILSKSTNLLDWTHSRINFRVAFGLRDARFSTVNRAWAPQIIWDPAERKYMVYLSVANEQWDNKVIEGQLPLTFYYAYANSDFTALEAVPKQFYEISEIDADICAFNGKYFMFYKTENAGNNIAMAVSDKLTGPYVMVNNHVDKTESEAEGCGTYRLYNTGAYVLMYDVYDAGRYEFTTTEDFVNFKLVTSSLNFHPRHGSVIPVTRQEMDALKAKWGN